MAKELFACAKDMRTVVHKTNGRHSNLILTPEDMGSEGFIVIHHVMDAGGFAPVHCHDKEQESMFFYEGTGVATIDGVEYDITPESLMFAPAGVTHGIRNTGDGPLKFVITYCPPLPEHVSRKDYFQRAKDRVR